MPVAYIVDCVRTAGGKRNGSLSKIHPADLGATVIDAIISRNRLDGKLVDDVILGCVSQVGAQSNNIARNAVLSSKLPISVPGTTVDRQCGSSQQALQFGAQAVMSGLQDIVICGGVESMSQVPIGGNVSAGLQADMGGPLGATIKERYPDVADEPSFSQFLGAELVAKEFKCSREECDKFSSQSHARAAAAIRDDKFRSEIIPVRGINPKTGEPVNVVADEGVREGTTPQRLSKLQPLSPEGIHTAGSASQITDGASAVLIMNEAGLKKTGLKPRARIVTSVVVGDDPLIMLRAPIPAVGAALKKAGLKVEDIDLFEINEAFAAVPLAVHKALNIPLEKVSVVCRDMSRYHQ